MKMGDTISGDASAYPRMRRELYDFNMRVYGSPYGPQGNPQAPLREGVQSFNYGAGG